MRRLLLPRSSRRGATWLAMMASERISRDPDRLLGPRNELVVPRRTGPPIGLLRTVSSLQQKECRGSGTITPYPLTALDGPDCSPAVGVARIRLLDPHAFAVWAIGALQASHWPR